MVDLTAYKADIENATTKNYQAPTNEHSTLFIDELFLAGYKADSHIVHGEITRISDPTDKPNKQSGWYIYYQGEEVSVGIYGSWKTPDQKNIWTSHSDQSMTFDQRNESQRQIKKAQEAQQLAIKLKQEEAALKAKSLFDNLPDANNEVPYLIKKQVEAYPNVKMHGDKLKVPIIFENTITSFQTISPDSTKRFMTGGKIKGCYFILEGKQDTVYIAEGYATGASIAMVTGCMVYIAFSAGNLYEVAAHAKTKHGKIIVCGDNDSACTKCTTQIKNSLHIDAIFPPTQYNDFNDWFVAEKPVMSKYFKKEKKTTKSVEIQQSHNFKPSGVIEDIINYYNATAKKEQPLFAIQAAIATCSVLLARNFETNRENRTSLFLMNVARSGTGKEHAIKVTESILTATNNDHLISGSGYTSQSAVISALQERPRHITIIDEFSKYLQASQNKNSGGHIAEANATLMQVIGRLEGKVRAKARASIGMTNAQKKELQNQTVSCPAITLLSMTTPDDLFGTIGVDAVKDGFINRFIICVSDAERSMPVDKEPMKVPESIINWESKIKKRKGLSEESPVIDPNVIYIPFDDDCLDVQNKFHKECIDYANKNEKFGLAEISGRSAEMAYRLALIIALSENPDTESISAEHMQQAINWVKYNLERLIKELKTNVSSSKHEAAKKEILKALRASKKGVTKTRMFKQPPYSKYERKVLDEILSELREAELIVDETEKREGAGRPTIRWRSV
ncbi:MAG: hypothetical protein Unbinned5081contig1002_24 [Prokaryotic dsDNA virus sp.]|nr:MAG: hypothetical protein Unbinned5081contig1002_24 [Prokaryotic dsDNA virus sp.]